MAFEATGEGNYLKDISQKIERTLQRFFDELRSHQNFIDFQGSDFEAGVLRPAEDAVIASGGKRLRPILAHLSHDILGGKNKDIERIAVMPELFHKGSVVIDDIEDSAPKDKNPLYRTYGKSAAINAGNFLYFMPQLILENTSLQGAELAEVHAQLNHTAITAHAGQALDIQWSGHPSFSDLPSEEKYISMIAAKTGSVFELCATLGGIAAGAQPEKATGLREITKVTAIAYQLRDDILSLQEGVGDYGADIAEGKVTLGLLYLSKNKPELGKKLFQIQSKSVKSSDDIREAISIMRDGGAIDYVERKIVELAKQAKNKLHAEFPTSRYRDAFDTLIDACVVRSV
ncbi:MAG: polyprenyl synthetase family protein [Patescibacteria group bacterium]